MFDAIEDLISWGNTTQKESQGGQMSLFATEDLSAPCWVKFGDEEWDNKTFLTYEKEAIGFYLSGHPLDTYRTLFKKHTTCNSAGLERVPESSEVIIGGQIQSYRKIVTSKGDDMAFVTLEDLQGVVDVVLFPKIFEQYKHLLVEDEAIVIKGECQRRNDRPNLLAQEIWPLGDWELTRIRSIVFQFQSVQVDRDKLKELFNHCSCHSGDCQVYLEIHVDGFRTVIKPDLKIEPGQEMTAFTQAHPEFKTQLRY